jgi:hypothetical protein
MKFALLLATLLTSVTTAFAGGVIQGDSLLLTGSHAATVRSLLAHSTSRTRNYIMVVGSLKIEGTNVRVPGENLGALSGPEDEKLHQLGNAFGIDASGVIYLRGVLPAYLIDLRSPRFACGNSTSSGAIGFPGTTSSACALR